MKNIIAVLILLLVCLLTVPQAGAASHSGQISMEFDLSAHAEGEEARLWIPYPVSDQDQEISAIRLSGDYAEAAVYTDMTHGTPMLYARWEKGAESRLLNLSFAVKRQEVIRRDFPARESAWDPADYAPYLAPTSLGPVDGQVKKLAARITKGQTSVLGKARAIYDWTVENMYRDPETRGCGSGDVCLLLEKPGGKCADISSVYVALARAAGVPSREVFGIRQGKKPVQDISGWQHCWAEFFFPGYGWVPVDPADVRKKMLQENLNLTDDRAVEAREYFWGGVDSYRLKLAEGRDLILNPPQQGGPVNYLMYPFAQIGKRTLDWLDPATFKYTITYREAEEIRDL